MDIQPDLSVCVVARQGPALLRDHLHALLACADPLALQVIVVVASGSSLAKELSREFPEILVYEEADSVRPAARARVHNRALALAAGRYLALLSDTVLCRPDCLRRLVEFMDEEPDVGLVGPRLRKADGVPLLSARAFPSLLSLLLLESPLASFLPTVYWRRRYLYADWDRESSREVGWLAGDCLLFRREVLGDIGPLDEGSGDVFADLDYCWRARRAGWHIVFRHDAEAVLAGDDSVAGVGKIVAGGRFLFRKWFRLLG